MNQWHVESLLPLLQEAGNLSLHYWKKVGIQTEFKSDSSPVTEGDRAVEALLGQEFNRPEEGAYLIGEETVDLQTEAYLSAALHAPAAWVVDPIDGTAPFASKLPMFGTCIGLMEHGKITEGAIIIPLFGELYLTDGDQVLMGQELDMSRPITRADLVPYRHCPMIDSMVTLSQLVTKYGQYRGPERVQTLCSCAFALGNLLCGRYKGYIGAGKIWDFVAGIALFQKAGGYVRKLDTPGSAGNNPLDIFVTAPDTPHRWSVKEHLVFAMNQIDADAFASHTLLSQP